jgi:hypothetical protein
MVWVCSKYLRRCAGDGRRAFCAFYHIESKDIMERKIRGAENVNSHGCAWGGVGTRVFAGTMGSPKMTASCGAVYLSLTAAANLIATLIYLTPLRHQHSYHPLPSEQNKPFNW